MEMWRDRGLERSEWNNRRDGLLAVGTFVGRRSVFFGVCLFW